MVGQIDDRKVELCLEDPGFEVDVFFTTDLKTMTEVVWRSAAAQGGRPTGG
jgi:hypothetical protein